MITEELITNLPWVFALMSLPMAFILIYAKDMVMLKVKTNLGRNKGMKLIVDITKDKNITFRAEKLNKDSKLQRDGIEVEWEPKRQYFSPQLGVQAAMTVQGSQSIFDPIGESKIDLADGEVVDRMVKRAELMRDMGKGWIDTREQKMMVAVIIICLITAAMTFAMMSQLGEFSEWMRIAVSGLRTAVDTIPRTL